MPRYGISQGPYRLPTGGGQPYTGPDLMGTGSSPNDGGSLPPPADNFGTGSYPGYSPSGPYFPGVDPSGFGNPFAPGAIYTGPGTDGYGGPSTPVSGGGPFVDVPTSPGGLPSNPFGGPNDTGLPGSANLPPSGGNPFSGAVATGYNYYDAGNGVTYVYDQNWNYIGTQNNPASAPPVEVAGQPPPGDSGHTPIRNFPSQGGRSPGTYPGGSNINFGSVGAGPSGAIGQGPDANYSQTYSGGTAAGNFNMMVALEGLGGGGPSINAKYQ